MAPKAKAKAKAKAGPKARPKVKAKAKARAGAMAVAGPGRRRPAVRRDDDREMAPEEKWAAGQEVAAEAVKMSDLSEGVTIVVPRASYYLRECKVAGKVKGIEVKEGEITVLVQLIGTTSESILKLHTSNPEAVFRLHLCKAACNQQEVSDTQLHGRELRKVLELDREEGWVTNLLKVKPLEEYDELGALRARGREVADQQEAGLKDPGKKEKKVRKEKKDEKKEEKKKRGRRAERDAAAESVTSSSEAAKVDGTMPRQAAKKSLRALFGGTGLDPREKVRRRVAKRAKRKVRKRNKKGSSSASTGSTGSSEASAGDTPEDGVFQQASKVRLVAAGSPGTLASQTLSQMRTSLLSEIGSEDKPGVLKACALAYYRQQIAKKGGGPAQREMLSIAATMDALLSGNVAGGMDILAQRFKSVEATMTGTHWTVSQRLEIAPTDSVQLAPMEEMHHARKDVYDESRLRWLASQPDGRTGGQSSGKGSNKTKGDSKDTSKGGGKERRWGKGPQNKGDGNKRREEGPPKPS